MRPTEIANLFKKPPETRLKFFLKTVAETQTVYGLADVEGWALLGNEDEADETDILPLFPNAALAEAVRKAVDFTAYTVESLTLEELFEWLGELEEEGMLIAVLPNPQLEGMVLEAADLKYAIFEE